MFKQAFVPPNSKSNADRKACIRDWGDACPQFKTFFDKERHHLGGDYYRLYLTDTCDSQNAFAGICSFLNVPQQKKEEIKEQLRLWQQDKSKNAPVITRQQNKSKIAQPVIRVAKFHYPLSVVTLIRAQEVYPNKPVQRDIAYELGIYKDRSPSAHNDTLIKYKPDLGQGITVGSMKKHKKSPLLRIVPCAGYNDVEGIAAAVQSKGSSSRIDMGKVREEYEKAQKELRSGDEWDGIVKSKDDVIEQQACRISELEQQEACRISELEQQVEHRDKSSEKHRKRSQRARQSLNEQAEHEFMAMGSAVMYNTFLDLLAVSGGISRLTIFNPKWHERLAK